MKRVAVVVLLAVVVTQDPDPHSWMDDPAFWLPWALGLQAQEQGPEPCEADRAWMCGQTEIGCSRNGHQPDGDTATEFYACSCVHTCNREGSPDDETQGRSWDRKCKTRCSPRHCHCPTKCET